MMQMINRILRWLMQPKSVENRMFCFVCCGRYCFTLFSVSLSGLPSSRQPSTSLRLENHLAFLVLMATSIYSFFFDKTSNGKPDAYSLISYASFVAIMSLGLSRLTQFGFEIDLLHFFCGGLIIQLLEIKRWLVIIGGCFIYFLVVILEQCLLALGLQLQALNTEDIENWIKTCKAAGKILFPYERRLCDSVFSGFIRAADVSFTKVCKDLTIPLLNDLCEIRMRMGILLQVVDLVYRDTVQATVAGGGLHPITKEVMKYILNICHYNLNSYQPFQIVRHSQDDNLEAKSRDYTGPALGYFFMMNNLRYIGKKAYGLSYKGHRTKLDDDWLQQNTAKVGQNLELYQRNSWNKMLDFLKIVTNE
uniref:Exocyst subunit Exo70 family protein n=1 Tax=Glycine max TaxID=3847 RepID=A0A0R0GFL3_SOYBN